ncbi:MAG: hypothetical protein QM535_20495 [Limnohabitans sp.]|nr:hypothetical protein [Limnohabitans sp.]
MTKFRLLIVITTLFLSCKKKEIVPEKIIQFSKKAIEASINTYPLQSFYQAYFDKSVKQEYIDKLKRAAIIWQGMEHNTELREANLVTHHGGNYEYLLKFWVTFKDTRKFSYSVNVIEKNGKMTVYKFEPMNVDIAGTLNYSDIKLDVPNFDFDWIKICFAYILIFFTLIAIIFLAIQKRNYLLLLTIPLLFIYNLGMTIFSFEEFKIIFSKTYFGLPLFQNIDLHFTSISLITTGVFFVWVIIGLFLFFQQKGIKIHNTTMNNSTDSFATSAHLNQ